MEELQLSCSQDSSIENIAVIVLLESDFDVSQQLIDFVTLITANLEIAVAKRSRMTDLRFVERFVNQFPRLLVRICLERHVTGVVISVVSHLDLSDEC